MNRLTSAILGELRTELRAASTEEFHRSTPVLGHLLDGVAHELDTLVSLHRQLDRTGTGDVVVLDAAAYGLIAIAMRTLLDEQIDMAIAYRSAVPAEVFLDWTSQVDGLAKIVREYHMGEVPSDLGHKVMKFLEAAYGESGGSGESVDGGAHVGDDAIRTESN